MSWSFLTSHAMVLIHVSREPDSTGWQVAQAAGITERTARRILADLEAGAYLEREKVGRRNRYRVDLARFLQPAGGTGWQPNVSSLLELVLGSEEARPQRALTGSVPPFPGRS